jgi:hypothetical protein
MRIREVTQPIEVLAGRALLKSVGGIGNAFPGAERFESAPVSMATVRSPSNRTQKCADRVFPFAEPKQTRKCISRA